MERNLARADEESRALMQANGHAIGSEGFVDEIEAKAVAVELACRLSGETQRSVGAWFGGVSSSAVGKLRGVLRTERQRPVPTSRLKAIDDLEKRLLDSQA